MSDIPVYLVTGFLESGKTKFIQETMQDKRFCEGEKILILAFEEGEEELNFSSFATDEAVLEVIEDKEQISPEFFLRLQKKYGSTKILIEYNGMWPLSDLYEAAPENWLIGQQILFFDSSTVMSYNANMRSLVVDKIQSADMIVFNRITDDMDPMEFHKLVRALSRSAAIIYEKTNGEIAYDEIEDPLPFDKEADVIVVEDKDYALFYRDLCENMQDYNGKSVSFKAIVACDPAMGEGTVFVGRHVMTCCVEDIQYSPMICLYSGSSGLKTGDWVTVEGKITVKRHKIYDGEGPVLSASKVTKATKPDPEVAVFY